MKPAQRTYIVALGAIAFLATTAAAAPCALSRIIDGGFEDVTDNAGVLTLDQWNQSDPSPVFFDIDPGEPEIRPRDGSYFVRFEGPATLHAEQTLTIPDDDRGTFSLYAKVVGTGTGTIRILIDGVELVAYSAADIAAAPNPGANGYKQMGSVSVPSVYLDGADHTIRIEGETEDGATTIMVDDLCFTTENNPVAGCPSGAIGLIERGGFEPETNSCADGPAAAAEVKAVWDGDPNDLITTCQDPAVDGNFSSPGFAHFPATPGGSALTQSGITLDSTIAGVFITFYLRMESAVADGETFKVFLVDESGESTEIWPALDDDADLTDYYNTTFGGSNLGRYVQVARSLTVSNEDPEDYTLRFEREGAAEFYLDDICLYAGGAVCTGGGTPTMTVLSSNTFADIDEDDDNYIGRAVTATIQLQYPVGALSVCTETTGSVFELQTQFGDLILLNDNLSYIDVTNGIVEFQIDTASMTSGNPIDGRTLMFIDGAPLIDDFIIDTVPPIVGPPLVSVAGTPSLDDLLNTTTLPGYTGLSFISASISDNLTGSAAAGIAGAPGVVNNLQPGNFYYEPWDTVYTADNRILTYANRAGRPAKVFFNDTPPLVLTVQCNFYDPPLEDEASGYLSIVSGFNTTLDNYTIEGSIVPTGPATWIQPADAVPSIQDTDTVNGHVANHATATWNINQAAPLGSAANDVYLNLRSNFFARDRAGNVRTLQESVLDGLEIWWMREARSSLDPDWSAVRPTPDQVYFDFAMDRTDPPNPLGAPLPIFNIEVFVGGPDPTDPTLAPFSTLGWVGWTPARRLTSAYFQDLVAGDPTLGNRWYAVRLVGADEAGNFETPPTIDLSTGTSGRNWQVFFLTGQEQSIDTTLGARFWWDSGNDLSRFNPNEGDQDIGSTNIVPMPPANVPHVVAVRFDIGAIAPQNIPLNTVSIAWQLEDEQTGDTIEDIYWYPTERTIRVRMPFDYAMFFGDPNRQVVRTYTFRAAARYELGGNLVQDPTPAVFRFRVVPGTVQQYLEDIADPQDQPVREVQRLD